MFVWAGTREAIPITHKDPLWLALRKGEELKGMAAFCTLSSSLYTAWVTGSCQDDSQSYAFALSLQVAHLGLQTLIGHQPCQ